AGMSGWHGELAEKLAAYATTAGESPELSEMLANGAPRLVDRNGPDWARDMLAGFGLSALAAVLIMAENQLGGVVLAHWAEQPAPECLDGALTERLTGLAGLAAVALDNSRLLEEARRQALHDPLTGLPNRALLEDRLGHALAQANRTGSSAGVLSCDVNRFKRINDSLGHGAGDDVLRHIAARLGAAVRSNDTVARYSGDEFVILLPDIATALEAEQIADRVCANLAEHLEIKGRTIFVDAAIGTATGGPLPDGESGALAGAGRQLNADADLDMYRSKAQARGETLSRILPRGRLRLETDLRGAAGRGELRVYFQPQVDVATSRTVAAEALVRWQHPELGMLSPVDFIPLAEENNLIREVGAHVLAEACRAAASWQAAGHPLEVSVNVSAVQLGSAGFTALVKEALDQAGLPAAALTLEVTESQDMHATSVNDGSLHELRSLGVGISVDDFGTGYSSLARLHQLPVTEVKIDKSFTERLAEDGSSAFIAGIVGLGHGLGLRVVAEGVETDGQLDALRAMGCERAQGYLLGKPVEAPFFEAELRTGADDY
ncbi:bifunctional diguanylate cyclase/phosphodiesterase, partial [Arthrobacter deserti]|nr:bifunctional diguanylate cyclase/phosphodiesterase [Arthrobacter deserti]